MSFTPFQRLVAQVTLEAIADLGFALGGGQALHAHGLGDRLSLDLGFYVTRFDQDLFDRAETATLGALQDRGYVAEVGHSDTWLRQVIVTDPDSGDQVVLDLGQDYRQHPPVVIVGLGPVIDLPDAAASRCATTYDPSSPPLSSPPTSPPPATRTPRTTTLTASPTPTSPAWPPTFPNGQPSCAPPRHSTMTVTGGGRLRAWVTTIVVLLSTLLGRFSSTSMVWPGSQAVCADVAVAVAVNPDRTPTAYLLDYRITAGHSHGPPADVDVSAANGHTYDA